jgi:hypothetical protein
MIELCDHYTTTEFPLFKPVCKLGYRAGSWCHMYDRPHYCDKYVVAIKLTNANVGYSIIPERGNLYE